MGSCTSRHTAAPPSVATAHALVPSTDDWDDPQATPASRRDGGSALGPAGARGCSNGDSDPAEEALRKHHAHAVSSGSTVTGSTKRMKAPQVPGASSISIAAPASARTVVASSGVGSEKANPTRKAPPVAQTSQASWDSTTGVRMDSILLSRGSSLSSAGRVVSPLFGLNEAGISVTRVLSSDVDDGHDDGHDTDEAVARADTATPVDVRDASFWSNPQGWRVPQGQQSPTHGEQAFHTGDATAAVAGPVVPGDA